MFLSDYHTHTTFSQDAEDTMEAMAAAHLSAGMKAICFTDHADDCLIPTDVTYPLNLYFEKEKLGLYDEYLRVRDKFAGKLDVRLGMELSSPDQNTEKAALLTTLLPFDFIIGSVHNIAGENDFYFIEYTSKAQCAELIDRYLADHLKMLAVGGFDVIGHIGYCVKYMAKQGIMINMDDWLDAIKTVLTAAIDKGIGIEVNTSGMRSVMNGSIPSPAVIKMYRQLGGEIITTGSDSHNVRDAGAGIAEATEIIKNAGFEYVTVFKNRKPEYIRI